MITLRQLPYIDILSLNDMMSFDTQYSSFEWRQVQSDTAMRSKIKLN